MDFAVFFGLFLCFLYANLFFYSMDFSLIFSVMKLSYDQQGILITVLAIVFNNFYVVLIVFFSWFKIKAIKVRDGK